ncbi:restriction endonuclease subunit S [Xanthomonas fragariae]|uniref:restriction endonuclease subunit S n=1 Tax=Xanthomonas fragariae TaxID=48664 RepID=UPI0022AA637A|nr:restriction endonuclease subunit S [Xanthomonas fragariae]WAT15645.1 restriction endonuclease subunit S [Xanthomonas fragariae]
MRSKVEEASVVQKEEDTVPMLRFPSFSGEWEKKRIGEVVEIYKGKGIAKGDVSSDGVHQCIRYGELYTVYEEVITNVLSRTSLPSSSLFFSEPYDVIIPSSGEKKEDIATAACVVPGGIALGGDLNVLRSRENGVFLSYYLNGPLRVNVARVAQGDSVVHLYPHQIEKLPVSIPSRDEQHEISDCLSSLDAYIGAEIRKLDALKTHKQGLMDQLFPAEGQRSPRLRFPGFDGEWSVARLSEVSIVVRGGSPRPIDGYLTRAADGLNWLKIGDVDKSAKYIERTQEKVIPAALSKTRQVHSGDLILSNSMSFGRPYISKISCCIHDGWLAITDISKQVNSNFLYYALGSQACQTYFLNAAAGSGVKNLNADIIKQLSVVIPMLEEQRRISECLSEIDDVIAFQSSKIASLQRQKAGLMQGLFPATGVPAP